MSISPEIALEDSAGYLNVLDSIPRTPTLFDRAPILAQILVLQLHFDICYVNASGALLFEL